VSRPPGMPVMNLSAQAAGRLSRFSRLFRLFRAPAWADPYPRQIHHGAGRDGSGCPETDNGRVCRPARRTLDRPARLNLPHLGDAGQDRCFPMSRSGPRRDLTSKGAMPPGWGQPAARRAQRPRRAGARRSPARRSRTSSGPRNSRLHKGRPRRSNGRATWPALGSSRPKRVGNTKGGTRSNRAQGRTPGRHKPAPNTRHRRRIPHNPRDRPNPAHRRPPCLPGRKLLRPRKPHTSIASGNSFALSLTVYGSTICLSKHGPQLATKQTLSLHFRRPDGGRLGASKLNSLPRHDLRERLRQPGVLSFRHFPPADRFGNTRRPRDDYTLGSTANRGGAQDAFAIEE